MLLLEGLRVELLNGLDRLSFARGLLNHDGSVRANVPQVQVILALDLALEEAHIDNRALILLFHLGEATDNS